MDEGRARASLIRVFLRSEAIVLLARERECDAVSVSGGNYIASHVLEFASGAYLEWWRVGLEVVRMRGVKREHQSVECDVEESEDGELGRGAKLFDRRESEA